MNQKDITQLVNLFLRLRRSKVSLPIIIVLVALTALGSLWSGIHPASPDSAAAGICAVKKVYDGDTMTLNCNGSEVKVRMYCIDTPEMQQTPWGKASRDYLRSITGNSVKLVVYDKDRYGRTVGEVYNGDTNLNLAQVEAGKAAVYRQYCKKSEYTVAEERAKAAKKGIWAVRGKQQTPWDWRKESK